MKRVRLHFTIVAVLAIMAVVFASSIASPIAFASSDSHAESHAGEHADHGSDKTLNPFDRNVLRADTAMWSLVIFVGLVLILLRFAYKPITQGLDQREQSVADNIAGAERANQEAKDLLAQYQNKLSEAEGEVRAIVEAGKKEAERAGEAIVAKAHAAAEAERIRATKEIESATDGALQELAKRSADLAVKLAGKIISKDLDAGSHADLIDSAVSDFSKN